MSRYLLLVYPTDHMAQVKKGNFTFIILDELMVQYHELVQLVLGTESMDDNEKQYWFDILPSMTADQVDRLYNILETERRKLEELELKYQEEIKRLNETHLIEWQELQLKKRKEEIAKAEASDEDNKKGDDAFNLLNI